MKISTRVECGIIALVDIAINSEKGTAISTAGISERQKISAKYLEQILIALKQANLIRGQKGSRGGYLLARPADSITFSEIINALDVTILCDAYVENSPDDSDYRATINTCLWDKMTAYMKNLAEQTTLSEIADRCRSAEAEKKDSAYMYYI
jgi:Rrf2 family protein